MIFEIHFPSPPLGNFISHFIYYKHYSPEHNIDRFLPDGNVEIIIELRDQPQFIYDNDTLKEKQACNKIWLSGIRKHFISIPSGKDSEMFVINFHKGRVYPFINMPLVNITDRVTDGNLILDKIFLELRQRILECRYPNQMFAMAETLLANRFNSSLQYNACTDHGVRMILQQPQETIIKKLVEETGYSSKHYINMFKEQVGVSPKAFLRIIRFQKAIQEIERNGRINWTALAAGCGYYDQAHFIADFKNFSGFTPQVYTQHKTDQLNYVPIG